MLNKISKRSVKCKNIIILLRKTKTFFFVFFLFKTRIQLLIKKKNQLDKISKITLILIDNIQAQKIIKPKFRQKRTTTRYSEFNSLNYEHNANLLFLSFFHKFGSAHLWSLFDSNFKF